jgi:GDP-L-fucose synthase
LLKLGAQLIVPDRQRYNLTQEYAAVKMIAEWRPDMVIHLAAKAGGIGANRAAPADFLRDNMLINLNVLEACRLGGVGKVVTVGSVCAYPKFTPAPFNESDLWRGMPEETNAPYGIAKRALLMACWAYRDQYGLNCIHLIPTNLYGPGDHFDLGISHVIPALIRKTAEALGDGPLHVWGDGSASRDFLYAEDAAEAIVKAAEAYDGRDPINIGSGCEVTIGELVETVRHLMKHAGEVVWETDKPNGQPRRCLNTRRAYEQFGWQAITLLDEGLRRTIDWYLARQVVLNA